jgi:hypothetical protein
MLSFYDDDSQYPAFFGPKDPTIRGDVVLRHLDWRRVALPPMGISPSQNPRYSVANMPFSRGQPSRTMHEQSNQLADSCTISRIAHYVSQNLPHSALLLRKKLTQLKICAARLLILQWRFPPPLRTLFYPCRFPGRATPQCRAE